MAQDLGEHLGMTNLFDIRQQNTFQSFQSRPRQMDEIVKGWNLL